MTVKLDRDLRAAIVSEVKTATLMAAQAYTEVWLTADELVKQFGMFNKDWLKRYGQLLPRTKVTVTDETTGEEHSTRWAYPRNRIQDMITSGRMRMLRIPTDPPRPSLPREGDPKRLND